MEKPKKIKNHPYILVYTQNLQIRVELQKNWLVL